MPELQPVNQILRKLSLAIFENINTSLSCRVLVDLRQIVNQTFGPVQDSEGLSVSVDNRYESCAERLGLYLQFDWMIFIVVIRNCRGATDDNEVVLGLVVRVDTENYVRAVGRLIFLYLVLFQVVSDVQTLLIL